MSKLNTPLADPSTTTILLHNVSHSSSLPLVTITTFCCALLWVAHCSCWWCFDVAGPTSTSARSVQLVQLLLVVCKPAAAATRSSSCSWTLSVVVDTKGQWAVGSVGWWTVDPPAQVQLGLLILLVVFIVIVVLVVIAAIFSPSCTTSYKQLLGFRDVVSWRGQHAHHPSPSP